MGKEKYIEWKERTDPSPTGIKNRAAEDRRIRQEEELARLEREAERKARSIQIIPPTTPEERILFGEGAMAVRIEIFVEYGSGSALGESCLTVRLIARFEPTYEDRSFTLVDGKLASLGKKIILDRTNITENGFRLATVVNRFFEENPEKLKIIIEQLQDI
jgi:hypothetical protein